MQTKRKDIYNIIILSLCLLYAYIFIQMWFYLMPDSQIVNKKKDGW